MNTLKTLILAAAAGVVLSACAGPTAQSKSSDVVAGGASVRLGKTEAINQGLSTQRWVKDEDNKGKTE